MRVLVTGENSYAGKQFQKRILELELNWKIEFVSVRNNNWKTRDFSVYDAIYHVAAIVHQKESSEEKSLYYKINRDLTYELALKAKVEGVKSFVFLSTIAVYGLIGEIGKETIISKNTIEKPVTYYGKSKLEAEQKISNLKSEIFNVSILRIPMIYGYNCPGNYKILSRLAKQSPVFPKITNSRSMVFVDHLSDVVIYIINEKVRGILLFQNPLNVSTLDMVNEIARVHNRSIINSVILGIILKKIGNKFTLTRKVFGNILFKSEDCFINGYNTKSITFRESIYRSEKGDI